MRATTLTRQHFQNIPAIGLIVGSWLNVYLPRSLPEDVD